MLPSQLAEDFTAIFGGIFATCVAGRPSLCPRLTQFRDSPNSSLRQFHRTVLHQPLFTRLALRQILRLRFATSLRTYMLPVSMPPSGSPRVLTASLCTSLLMHIYPEIATTVGRTFSPTTPLI